MTAVVLITGAPGTGKSTLADAAANELSAAVLAWDWVMASLTPFEEVQAAFRQMDRERYRSLGWAVLWNLAIAQLRAGRSAVLDGVARDVEVRRFRELAADVGVASWVVWAHCSDVGVHRSRVEGRIRGIPGWHELEWAHVELARTTLVEPADVDLRVDAVASLVENQQRLRAVLAPD